MSCARTASRSVSRPVSTATIAMKGRSNRSRARMATRDSSTHAGAIPSDPSASGRTRRRPIAGSTITRALGDSASLGRAIAATSDPSGDAVADQMPVPWGSSPVPARTSSCHPPGAASPASPAGASKARPSRSTASRRPPAIGTTAATDGPGSGSVVAMPERPTMTSEGAAIPGATSRRAGPPKAGPGDADREAAVGVALAGELGGAAGVVTAVGVALARELAGTAVAPPGVAIGEAGEHPAAAMATRGSPIAAAMANPRIGANPMAGRHPARPRAGRGATW